MWQEDTEDGHRIKGKVVGNMRSRENNHLSSFVVAMDFLSDSFKSFRSQQKVCLKSYFMYQRFVVKEVCMPELYWPGQYFVRPSCLPSRERERDGTMTITLNLLNTVLILWACSGSGCSPRHRHAPSSAVFKDRYWVTRPCVHPGNSLLPAGLQTTAAPASHCKPNLLLPYHKILCQNSEAMYEVTTGKLFESSCRKMQTEETP